MAAEFDYALYFCAGDGNFGSDMILGGFLTDQGWFSPDWKYVIIVNKNCDIDWFKSQFPFTDASYVTWLVNTDANINRMIGAEEIMLIQGGCFDTFSRINSLRNLVEAQSTTGNAFVCWGTGLQGYQQNVLDTSYILEHSLIRARDDNTYDIASTIGCIAVWTSCDMAQYVLSQNSFVTGTNVPSPSVRIGLSVGNKDFHYECTTRWRFCQMLSSVHATLQTTYGWTITWVGIVQSVGHDTDPYMDDRDVFDYLNDEGIIPITYTTPINYVEYLDQYNAGESNQFDIVISASRLHGLVCADYMGFPTIAYYLTDPNMHKYQAYCEDHASVQVVLDYDTDEQSGPDTSAANMVTACLSAYDQGHPA